MMGTRRAIVFLFAIFLLGVVVGALGERLVEQRWRWGHRSWREQRAKVVERFTKELALSTDQRDRFARILDETGDRYRKLSEQVRPQYEEIRQSARQRIRAILSPEQRAKFEEIVRKIDEERRATGHRR